MERERGKYKILVEIRREGGMNRESERERKRKRQDKIVVKIRSRGREG